MMYCDHAKFFWPFSLFQRKWRMKLEGLVKRCPFPRLNNHFKRKIRGHEKVLTLVGHRL